MKKSYSIQEIVLGIIIMFLGVCLLIVQIKFGYVILVSGFLLFLVGCFMKRLLKFERKIESGADQIIEDEKGRFIEVIEEN